MDATSPYESITPESLKAEMLAGLAVKGADIDTREGSYSNILVSAAAYQLYKFYQQLPALLSMMFPDENSGEYIDRNAAQIGMTRSPGVKARAVVVFTGADGTRLPTGTALYAPESGLKFLTLEDTVICGGTARAEAEAAEEGAEHNLPAGSITSMYVNVPGVASVTNPDPAFGGSDTESDGDFFARYHARRSMPITSGNQGHYIAWASEVPGVSHAGCIPLWDGPGTVKVIIAGADRRPVPEWVRAACAAHIEENRPIGAAVTVVSVTCRSLPLAAHVTLVDGFTAEEAARQLKENVNSLLAGLPFGQTVRVPYSRFLAQLLQCPAVADYRTFTVDGAEQAVTIGAGESAEAGSVTILT